MIFILAKEYNLKNLRLDKLTSSILIFGRLPKAKQMQVRFMNGDMHGDLAQSMGFSIHSAEDHREVKLKYWETLHMKEHISLSNDKVLSSDLDKEEQQQKQSLKMTVDTQIEFGIAYCLRSDFSFMNNKIMVDCECKVKYRYPKLSDLIMYLIFLGE